MSLPANVHVSRHPCLLSKLSQLRSGSVSPKEVKALVHEISLIVGCEALATAVTAVPGPKVRLPRSCDSIVKKREREDSQKQESREVKQTETQGLTIAVLYVRNRRRLRSASSMGP